MRSLRSLGALACAAGLLGMLPAAAGANVQVGSSGWQWGNPLPQGNTIRAMSFAGAQGYAAGDFGTLLSTADGGATWTGLPAGTFTGLYEVQAIDADSMFAGRGCVARRSDDAGRTFRRIAFTSVESICREGLAAGWFVSEQTGYLVLNDGTTLRTDNDGDTFAQKVALPGTRAQGGGAAPSPAVRDDDRPRRSARAHGRRRQHGDAGDALARSRACSGLRLAGAHRGGRRAGLDGGQRRRGRELHAGRRSPERRLQPHRGGAPGRHGVRPGRQRWRARSTAAARGRAATSRPPRT
jgi:hypothetical protein